MHLKLRDQQLKQLCIYVSVCVCVCVERETAISKPHGNHKPKNYKRYIYKKEKNPSTTLNTVIKSEEKKRRKKKMTLQNQIQNSSFSCMQQILVQSFFIFILL